MSSVKTIVITGASGGIGAALATELAREGHSLALVARREKELNEVGAQATTIGAKGVLCIVADVVNRDEVERVARETVARFGGFDVWVNNAGRGITRDVLDLTDSDIDEVMSVNVKSAVWGMQVAAEHFLARNQGQIVNVSSFLGRVPTVGFRSVYSAAKAALNSLTANLRTDLAARSPDIMVTLVMPSVVTTDFARNVIGERRPPVTGGNRPPSQTAEEVAAIIAGAIRTPVAEVYTNPATLAILKAYQDDIVGFEARMRPR